MIKDYLWERLAADWTTRGRDWVQVSTIESCGETAVYRIQFFENTGEDSNVFTPPTAVSVLSDLKRYLLPSGAYPHSLYVEDLGPGRKAYRVGVCMPDFPDRQDAYDSGCEDMAGE